MTVRHPPIRLFRLPNHASSHQTSFKSVRYASSSSNPPLNRIRNLLYGSTAIVAASIGYLYATDTRASIHEYVVPPLIRLIYPDAEEAHHFGTRTLQELYTLGLHPRERGQGDADGKLSIEVFGTTLANPIGISGGLDKHANIPDALLALGPSVVEIGGVTPLPQGGNPQPRVFRIVSQNALINRYGLNSDGADVVAMRLRQRVREFAYQHGFGMDEEAERLVLDGETGAPPGSLVPGRLLAVQIAKNKLTPDTDLDAVVWDHVYCVDRLGKYADILVVNVSSPNTPGLRSLQSKKPLTQILSAVVDAANAVDRKSKPIVMVKVSPDEDSESQIQGICDAVWESGVSGVIVGNTTMKRPSPLPEGYELPAKDARALVETGGYSGPQLFSRTKELVAKYRKALDEGPSEDIADSSPQGPSNPSAVLASSSAESLESSIIEKIETSKIRDEATLKSPSEKSLTDPSDSSNSSIIEKIEASVTRDKANLKSLDEKSSAGRGSGSREIGTGIKIPESSSENQPLIQLPERNDPLTSANAIGESISAPVAINTQSASTNSMTSADTPAPNTISTQVAPSKSSSGRNKALASQPKVIFASGGITNGEQALEVLNAGASVAMMYTAVVYGGVGTVGKIKQEMRQEINAKSKK